MKITFAWRYVLGMLIPCCEPSEGRAGEGRLLANLLMDDGGLDRETTTRVLDEGIRWASNIASGKKPTGEWDRETWSARYSEGRIEVHSLHDDNCVEFVAAPIFLQALIAWREFVLAPADEKVSRTFESGSD